MLPLARFLIILGVVFLLVGGVVYLFSRLGIDPARLPGNIRLQSGNVTCLIPLAASIILSIVLTIALNLVIRFLNR